MGYALRLRWEWLARTDPQRLWFPLPCREERIVHAIFQALVTVQIGNNLNAMFWVDRWLHGSSVESMVPDLVAAVAACAKKTRMGAAAFHQLQWVRDISGSLSIRALTQYLAL
jgi:hypothetical protein